MENGFSHSAIMEQSVKKLLLLITIGIFFMGSCLKTPRDPEEDWDDAIFDNSYTGTLTITFSCEIPEFTSTATCRIEMDRFGTITCGQRGTLEYAGESITQDHQSKIRRKGVILYYPNGSCECGGYDGENEDCTLTIYEGATGLEDMTYWAWDDDNKKWNVVVDEKNIPVEWNRGYGFSYNKATTTSHRIEVIEFTGKFVYELWLTPNIN